MILRDSKIDFLNGMGILFVVIGHYSYQMECSAWFDWIWSFHMPLFFVTGGYLIAKKEKGYINNGYIRYVKKQIKHLLIPYAIFFAISFVVGYICVPILKKETIHLSYKEGIKLIIAFLFGGGYLENVKINNFPLWFFQLYFIAKLVFVALCYLKQKHIGLAILLFAGNTVFILMIQELFLNVMAGRLAFHINVLPVAILCMGVGYIYQRYIEVKDKVATGDISESITLAIMWLCFFGGIIITYQWSGNVGYIGNYMYILGAMCTIYGFYILASYLKSPTLRYMGKNSMLIFGLHGLFMSVFRNYIQNHVFSGWNGAFRYFVLCGIIISMLNLIVFGLCTLRKIVLRCFYKKYKKGSLRR